jgi:hypothetical protein
VALATVAVLVAILVALANVALLGVIPLAALATIALLGVIILVAMATVALLGVIILAKVALLGVIRGARATVALQLRQSLRWCNPLERLAGDTGGLPKQAL